LAGGSIRAPVGHALVQANPDLVPRFESQAQHAPMFDRSLAIDVCVESNVLESGQKGCVALFVIRPVLALMEN